MEKLLILINIMQKSGSQRMIAQLVLGITIIIGLTFTLAIMVSAVFLGALFAIYFALMQYGVEPQAAMLTIAIAAIFIILSLVMLIISRLRQLRQLPKFCSKYSPFSSCAISTLDAFTAGLMAK